MNCTHPPAPESHPSIGTVGRTRPVARLVIAAALLVATFGVAAQRPERHALSPWTPRAPR